MPKKSGDTSADGFRTRALVANGPATGSAPQPPAATAPGERAAAQPRAATEAPKHGGAAPSAAPGDRAKSGPAHTAANTAAQTAPSAGRGPVAAERAASASASSVARAASAPKATFGTPGRMPAARGAVPAPAAQANTSRSGTAETAPVGTAAPATDVPHTVPPGAPALLAPPVRLHYRVSGQARRIPYTGLSGTLLWQHDGAHYTARLEVGAPFLGKRVQTSAGDIDAGGLLPRRYSDRTRSELAAHFERDKGQISFSANTPATPLLAGAQDRLSVLLQLAAQLDAQPTLARPGTRWQVQTAGPREAENWLLEIEAAETLDLPGGPTPTWRLVRAPQREYDTRVEVWLAPGQHHLPVQLRLTQANGDRVQLLLEAADNP